MPQDHPAEAQAATEAEPAPAEAAPAAPQPEPALAEAAPAAPQPEPALAEAAPAAPQPEPAAEPAAPEANVLDSLFSYRRGSDQAPAAVASAAVESEVASTVEVQPPKAIPVIIERTPAVEVKPASPVATPPPSSELCDASAWRQFVHSLADNHELAPLQALLATGHFLSAAADEITVGFRADLPLRQTERLAETPSFLERSRQQFGERVTLAFTLAPEGSGGRSLSDELQRIRSEHREQGENDARQHPAISRTLDAFPGAGIKSVHVPKLEEIKDVR